METLLPDAVTPDEAMLLGPTLNAGPEYQRALLRSAYRQEILLSAILDRLGLLGVASLGEPLAAASIEDTSTPLLVEIRDLLAAQAAPKAKAPKATVPQE